MTNWVAYSAEEKVWARRYTVAHSSLSVPFDAWYLPDTRAVAFRRRGGVNEPKPIPPGARLVGCYVRPCPVEDFIDDLREVVAGLAA